MATVLVSPDGALGLVPLAALPGQAPGTYLIEEHAIALVPVPRCCGALAERARRTARSRRPRSRRRRCCWSATSITARPRRGRRPGREPVGRPRHPRRAWAPLPTLPATGDEIRDRATLFKQALPTPRPHELRRRPGHRGGVAPAGLAHRYLHLATHGYFAPRKLRSALAPEPAGPRGAGAGAAGDDLFGGRGVVGFHPGLLSGLALAGANRPPEPGQDDGILTALEVAELDLSGVELAVLSACETGLGEVAGGEGLLGLQRAFQVAGARGVVASLWKVDDEPTRALMARFYENLWGKQMGKLEALREAQLWMLRGGRARAVMLIEEGQPAGRSDRVLPFYWAAFVLSGDWR